MEDEKGLVCGRAKFVIVPKSAASLGPIVEDEKDLV